MMPEKNNHTLYFGGIADVSDRLVAKDDLCFAFPTNIPITPGHTLVCPLRQVTKMEELTNKEKLALLSMVEKVKEALRQEPFSAKGFHTVWNEEKPAGQTVDHLHLHVVPRTPGDRGITEYEPRKFLYRPGSRKPSPDQELQEVARILASSLSEQNT